MKILIISGGHLPIPASEGGAVEMLIDTYILENEKKFHNEIDVISIAPHKKIENIYNYTNFIYIERKSKINLKKLWYKINNKIPNRYIGNYFLNESIKNINKNYDIILCENEPLYCTILKKKFNSKIVLHLHNNFLTKTSKMYNEIISSCDKIISVSDFIKSKVDCDEKCVTVYNGIDIERFSKELDQNKMLEIKENLNIKDSDFVYLYVGRIVPEKGIGELVTIFEKINKKYSNTKLLVIGTPFFRRKRTSKFYDNLMKKSNKNIIYTGYIDNNSLQDYYKICDVQITPSIIDEAFGLTALEAMASGKSVIVTDAGGLPEVVMGTENKIVRRKNIEQELYEAMESSFFKNKVKNIEKGYWDRFSQSEYSNNLNTVLKNVGEKMKKIAIITLTGNNNYGNRLQNYALQEYLKKMNNEVYTIWIKENFTTKIKKIIKKFLGLIVSKYKISEKSKARNNNFIEFTNKYIQNFTIQKRKIKKINNQFDKFVFGSDQIWNPNVVKNNILAMPEFLDSSKKISYAASLGVSNIDNDFRMKLKNQLDNEFSFISVREEKGREIIEQSTKRKDVEVLLDPTMLLSIEEWDNITKKPENLKSKKYILNYFLGTLSEERKKEIERIAKEYQCDIIELLDPNDPLYESGPSEFLYLEKNAFLVCTDSFHSCVFAILYNRPFIVFDREDSKENMSSRLDTLLSKFDLQDRRFNGRVPKDLLECDYSKVEKILKKEKEKSINFLKRALDIEE